LATDQSQKLLWSWNSDAFGVGKPNQDVDGNGIQTDIPLRFPGQQYDGHSGLNYNYFRDYDPETGRYVESDPIGLRGGLNTYGYVMGNPLSLIDKLGLAPGDLFGSPDDAAVDAGNYSRGKPNQSIEYGGWVFRKGNCWTYNFIEGEAASQGKPASVPGNALQNMQPTDANMIWHTHPRSGNPYHDENFSDNDYNTADGISESGATGPAYGIYLNTPGGNNLFYDGRTSDPSIKQRYLPRHGSTPNKCGCQP
uniref:RHS repeat-associated core domain-containing protein n=1 Tax=Pseudomonas sp. 2FE TaxID=2502190 RepID=UPI0010F7EA36